ncbi:hypothetical protein X777_04302, partial [Ooceraea biroi]
TANPKDLKYATSDAVSLFFLLQRDDRLLSNVDAVGLVKIVLSLGCFAPLNTSISHTSLSASHVQSDGDLFSTKVEQSVGLIDNAYRQIRNAPYDNWQVNDLSRPF